jgi:hypothetical protein
MTSISQRLSWQGTGITRRASSTRKERYLSKFPNGVAFGRAEVGWGRETQEEARNLGRRRQSPCC